MGNITSYNGYIKLKPAVGTMTISPNPEIIHTKHFNKFYLILFLNIPKKPSQFCKIVLYCRINSIFLPINKTHMNRPARLLIVEVDTAFAASLIAEIKGSGIDAEYKAASNATAFAEALSAGFPDIILFGKGAPGFDVFTALAQLKGTGYNIPLLYICDSGNEENAVRAMQMGARDYIVKKNLKRLSPVISRELSDIFLTKDKEVALEALAVSEKRYEDLINISPDVIYILTPKGTVASLSPVFENLTGWSLDEVIGKSIRTLFHPDDFPLIAERFRREMSGETVETQRARIMTKSGDYVIAEFKSAPIVEKGEIVGVRGSARDVTERSKYENTLKESEEKFRLLSEQSLMGIIIIQDERVKYVNDAATEISGYPKEEILGWEPGVFINIIHPEDRPVILEQLKKRMSGAPDVVTEYEYRGIRADGSIRWILQYSKIIIYEGRKADLITLIDITDRKKTEAALSNSEERYRNLVESSPSAIAIHSGGKLLYVNDSCLKIMGGNSDEVIGKSVIDFVHPDFRKIALERMKKVQRNEIIGEAIEDKFLRLDGTTVDVEVIGTPIVYSGKPAVQVTFWDITEHKRTKKLLAESEERYRSLQNNVPVGIFRTDAQLNGEIISANIALADMFGYKSVSEILNVRVADFYLKPEDRAEFTKTMRSLGIVNNYEVIFKRQDGATFWGSISARAVKGPDGEVTNFDGILKEITERKNIENALTASEKTYRSLYESNQALADVTDLETVIEVITRTARDLLGATDSTLFRVNQAENLLEPIYYYPDAHYEEVMKFRLKIGEGLSGKVAETGEARLINYDEEDSISVHVPGTDPSEESIESIMAVPMFEDDGSVLGVISIGLVGAKFVEDDLNKLNFFTRQAEIAIKRARFYDILKESEEKYRGVVDKSLVGLFINQKGIVKFANQRLVEMFGYNHPEEIIGQDIFNFIAPESRAVLEEQARQRDQGKVETSHYEFKAIKKDGSIFDVETLSNQIIYEGAPAVQGSLIDITERKRAEEELKRDRQAFALIAEAATEAENTSDLSQRILDGLIELLGFKMGSVRLLEATSGLLSPIAVTGFQDKPIEEVVEAIDIDDDNYYIASLAARTKEPVFAPDVKKHAIYKTHKKRLNALGIGSIISWPLLNIDKTVLGVIQLASSEVKTLSESDRLFFESIMSTFTTALAKQRTDEEMIELRRAKDTLTDLVVHDIKNISSTMYSWLEMIDEEVLGTLTEEQADAVKRIAKQNEGLFQLSEEMLDIARAEEGDINLNKISYALDNQVLDVIEYYFPTVEKENKVIRYRFEDETIIINADESRVRRVIANLIQNAVQFAPPDSGQVFVSLQIDKNAKTAAFTVTDNGPGIPEEFQTLIFEKYSQAELKSQGLKKGHGLGLTYCKMIVEAHGGIINVESDGKTGSAFSFILPIVEK